MTKKKPKKVAMKNILSRIKDEFHGMKNNSAPLPANSNNLMSWVNEDHLLRGSLQIKHDTLMRVGWYLVSTDGGDLEKAQARLKELRFARWMSRTWFQELIFKTSFTELNRDSTTQVQSMHVVDTQEVEIVADSHGTIKGYLQVHNGVAESNENNAPAVVTLPKDKIVHIDMNHIDSSLWSSTELSVARQLLWEKKLLEDYLIWLFKSNQFRTVIKIPDMTNEDDIDMYIEMLRRGMEDPKNFLMLQGDEADVKLLRQFDGIREVLALISNYTGRLLTLFQLPPIGVGDTDGSNRSNAEYQVRYTYHTHIRGLLNMKGDEINNELFPMLGDALEGIEIRFNLTDDKAVLDTLDMAQKLSGMGADKELLEKWLRNDMQVNVPAGIFKDAPNDLKMDKNDPMQESRQPTEMQFNEGLESGAGDVTAKSLATQDVVVKRFR